MKQAKIKPEDRKVVTPCLERAQALNAPAAAIELEDGTIVTGKTSSLLGASAAVLLNAIKVLGEIPHDTHLIAPSAIEPIQTFKDYLSRKQNPRLHTDEVLIALSHERCHGSGCKKSPGTASQASGCQVHTSVMLSNVDIKTFKKLGMNLTSEPVYEHKKLYH